MAGLKRFTVAVGWKNRNFDAAFGADEVTVTAASPALAIAKAVIEWHAGAMKSWPEIDATYADICEAVPVRKKPASSPRQASPRKPRSRPAPKGSTSTKTSGARGRNGKGRSRA